MHGIVYHQMHGFHSSITSLHKPNVYLKRKKRNVFKAGRLIKTFQLYFCLSNNADRHSFIHLELLHFILLSETSLGIHIKLQSIATLEEFQHVTALHSERLCRTPVPAIEKYKNYKTLHTSACSSWSRNSYV